MTCTKCGHDDASPMGKCLVEVIEKNAKVIELDGTESIEPEMPGICACKEPAHYEAIKGFPDLR